MEAYWIVGIYTLGSIVGYYMGKGGHKETVAKIIDNLIDSGYLRTEKKQDGEIEIKRWND
jgi:hypothetical protein|tara:strand:- start:3030 stop:3209 length:180 start_codon:yes stop_codon:yes gene_type:complete